MVPWLTLVAALYELREGKRHAREDLFCDPFWQCGRGVGGSEHGSGGGDVMGLTLSMQVSCWGSPVGIIITMVGAYSLRTYSVWATMQGSSHHVHSHSPALCS